MKKDYYEILEISKNASDEVVEKAYKALVKKYHPDLKEGEEKKQAEEKIKEINEAYEIISNPEKRSVYDKKGEMANIVNTTYTENNTNEQHYYQRTGGQQQTYQKSQENINYNKKTEEKQSSQPSQNIKEQVSKEEYEAKMQEAIEKAYKDAYIQDMKNRGYRIRYKKTIKDYIRIMVTILATVLILFLIIQIPFVKKFFVDLYNQNDAVKTIVDIIIKLYKSVSQKG